MIYDFNVVLLVYSSIYLCYRLFKGYQVIYNQFFILNIFFTLYFLIPSVFYFDIVKYNNWNIPDGNYILSSVLVTYYFLIFHVSLVFSKDFEPKVNFNSYSKLANRIAKAIYYTLLFYVIAVFILNGGDLVSSTYTNQNYTGEQPLSIYKIKNIAYLSIFLVPFLYVQTKRSVYFLLGLFLIILDLAQGTRTIAFIAFSTCYLSYVYTCGNLRLKLVFLVIILMGLTGYYSRASILELMDVPWYISAIGEFKETYIPLPLLISNADFVGAGSWVGYLSVIFGGVLQPFISFFMSDFVVAAQAIVKIVARGYGQGSNLIVESLYQGWYYTLIYPFIVILVIKSFNYCIKYSSIGLMLAILSFVLLRLGIREGLLVHTAYSIYFVLFYWLPVILLIKVLSKKNEETPI
ncbi:hypothetical protein CWO04_10020 [Vibrio splendidus]|uniref:hypothetical protein n=1 Tax=Vibrio splendidus TaxID=29497 RepID=UPI000D3966FA|nr:hypothetical protein [Vibrio splendidus]PTP86655.1 hypothetical protein CWO04_10020 [Vibrio splendidus]